MRRPSAARSSTWPPIIPPAPAARNSSRAMARRRSGGSARAAIPLARTRAASATMWNPARVAVATSNARCVVGRPRRRASSSMQGRTGGACTPAGGGGGGGSAVEVLNPEDFLHRRLRLRETLPRIPQAHDAFLKQLQRLVQVQLLALEPAHDLLEPLDQPAELRE